MLSEVREFIESPDPARFDRLALEVFGFQFERNVPYRRFCERRGRTPSDVSHWTEVPAVPVSAFKQVDLAVGGLGDGVVYLTSGTTRGAENRGRHHVPDPSIYHASALKHFGEWVLPDGARPRLIVLAPAFSEQPQSSLCQMIEWIAESSGEGRRGDFVREGELRERDLVDCLRALEPSREPVLVIGVTHAFIRFIDFCQFEGLRFRLPYGSRIVDTGGTKGRSRPMSRNGLLRAYWEAFAVPGYYVANEYGMTEMCSQFYDNSIRNHVEGKKRDRCKIGPAWVRTQVVSPETLLPVASGERGLLRHFDLANVGSVAAIQTEDVGLEIGDGFEIVGRAEGAEARGCALLLQEIEA
jgi:hypothetical protein